MNYDSLEDGYVETSLGKIHYKQHEAGGKKVIFLHGFAFSMKSFARLVEQLPEDLGVYLVDLLGHGDSDAPKIEYRVGTQARVVREFIDAKRIQDSYLFGHSYGGWIAATIAQGNYRGRGVVLEDSVGLSEYFAEVRNSGKEKERTEKLFKEALETNPREYVIRSSLNDRSPADYLTKESLSSIIKPALVLWGSDDKTLSPKYAKLFNEYIKGSVLEIVQDAGHSPHYTHAPIVKKLLLKFIGY